MVGVVQHEMDRCLGGLLSAIISYQLSALLSYFLRAGYLLLARVKMKFLQNAICASLCLVGIDAFDTNLRIGSGGRTIHQVKREVRRWDGQKATKQNTYHGCRRRP